MLPIREKEENAENDPCSFTVNLGEAAYILAMILRI